MPSEGDLAQLTAVVLAGGRGTRLRSVIDSVPKALAPVCGRPFLDYQLRYVASFGIRRVVLCTGIGAPQIEARYRRGAPAGVGVRFSRELAPLGTAGAIKHAEPAIDSDPFLVLNGDSLMQADLAQLVRFHHQRGAAATMALMRVPDRGRFGAPVVEEDGSISRFSEKEESGSGWINAGVYVLDRTVLAAIPAGKSVSIEYEVFPALAGHGLYGLPQEGAFVDIGTPEAYAGAPAVLTASFPWLLDTGQGTAERPGTMPA